MTIRTCRKCSTPKELEEFAKHPQCSEGRTFTCKLCMSANSKRWYKTHTSHHREQCDKRYYKKHYNLSVEEVSAMECKQPACAICSRPFTKVKRHVDHDHLTGKVRALLCMNCNRGLGYMKDNPDLLRKAAEYVEAHRE